MTKIDILIGCPTEISEGKVFLDQCYWIPEQRLSYLDASQFCFENGGILAEPRRREAFYSALTAEYPTIFGGDSKSVHKVLNKT